MTYETVHIILRVVGWDTALKAGRSLVRYPTVSLEFFIYFIHPSALRLWGRLSL